MSLHEQAVGKSDEWYTPPYVFDAMGVRFDLDVASPGQDTVPWLPARLHICGKSLEFNWGSKNFIWMNPPFGGRNGIEPWLAKFFEHGNGVALTPDRTSAPWWQDYAPKGDAILFVRKKIRFISGDGRPNSSPAQGTTLMAAGPRGVEALHNARRAGLGLITAPLSVPATAPQPKQGQF